MINGKESKPSRQVKEGDVIELVFSAGKIRFEVLSVRENVRKDEADSLYRIIPDGEET